jgi:hypothetical protein
VQSERGINNNNKIIMVAKYGQCKLLSFTGLQIMCGVHKDYEKPIQQI